jgi:uncharacterized membrane protein YedE/YeeE
MRQLAVAFVAGVVFAIGLGMSGMTDPDKVLGFLDVGGAWDPSLAFVMGGAILAHVGAAQWSLRAQGPLWSGAFVPTGAAAIDAPLVVGSALFGLGWGTAGFCPGPALVDLVAPSTGLVAFLTAVVVGMAAFRASLRVWPKARMVTAEGACA